MKTILFIPLFLVLFIVSSKGQNTTLYHSDTLRFVSKYYGDTLVIDFHIPKTFDIKSDLTTYPLIILFDNQNVNTHLHNLRSINYITEWGHQMPESIVIGFPFSIEERTYYTSNKVNKGDSLSGIQKTEHLLFEELLPFLKDSLKCIDYTILIGHSRTGYLVNHLMTTRYLEFDVAVSASGFYRKNTMEDIQNKLYDNLNQRERPFKYYMSSGSNTEVEASYKENFDSMEVFFQTQPVHDKFYWKYFKHPNSNHMTNYTLSVPAALVDIFSNYNAILDQWLFVKLNEVEPDTALALYQEDLAQSMPGVNIPPSIIHIMSIASHYYNNKDYKVALDFLLHGETFYPNLIDIQLFIADSYHQMGRLEQMETYLNRYLELIQTQSHSKQDLKQFDEWYHEIVD